LELAYEFEVTSPFPQIWRQRDPLLEL